MVEGLLYLNLGAVGAMVTDEPLPFISGEGAMLKPGNSVVRVFG